MNRSDSNQFFYTGMTPRAWRMISYSCVGFFIYSAILFTEMLQNVHLYKIDHQLKLLNQSDAQQEQFNQDINP
jgi:hypothetical protein